MHILCCYFEVVLRAIWAAIFLHILRVPFLPRAPPFYTAHARLSGQARKWAWFTKHYGVCVYII